MTGTKEDWNKGEAMGGLIWIIVIVVVISEIKKFQRKNGQRVKPNVPRHFICGRSSSGRAPPL